MKPIILLLTFMAILNISYGQIETKYYPNKNALKYTDAARFYRVAII